MPPDESSIWPEIGTLHPGDRLASTGAMSVPACGNCKRHVSARYHRVLAVEGPVADCPAGVGPDAANLQDTLAFLKCPRYPPGFDSLAEARSHPEAQGQPGERP